MPACLPRAGTRAVALTRKGAREGERRIRTGKVPSVPRTRESTAEIGVEQTEETIGEAFIFMCGHRLPFAWWTVSRLFRV